MNDLSLQEEAALYSTVHGANMRHCIPDEIIYTPILHNRPEDIHYIPVQLHRDCASLSQQSHHVHTSVISQQQGQNNADVVRPASDSDNEVGDILQNIGYRETENGSLCRTENGEFCRYKSVANEEDSDGLGG